ncbi:3'-5' exonuclease [Pseudoglutamicibacter albus]|uniref:3'-5' exonuclease n=1 Tax=Pseudoglutamicibacter albus TaxID=98671 RepID=UPI0036238E91
MAVDFVAIDFETANGFRGSACAVGLVRVRDGAVVDTYASLLQPPAGFDHFDPRNVSIHGIHPEQVETAPRFADAYPEIAEFIGGDLVLAHNAAFDIGVIRAGLQACGVGAQKLVYACTVQLARKVYDLMSYSLPFAAHAAGFDLTSHHDALADARACAAIGVDAARRLGASTMTEAVEQAGLQVSTMASFKPGTLSAKRCVTRADGGLPGTLFRNSWMLRGRLKALTLNRITTQTLRIRSSVNAWCLLASSVFPGTRRKSAPPRWALKQLTGCLPPRVFWLLATVSLPKTSHQAA